MRDEWFRTIELPLTWEQFHQLPRNAAYKYEYFDQRAWLTPRPKFYHARMSLQSCEPVREVDAQWQIVIRPLRDEDWSGLPSSFAAAFDRVTPLSSMSDDERLAAARVCLEETRAGEEGPLMRSACFVAVDATDPAKTVGAILVTLAPERDLSDWYACRWNGEPPPDAIERRLGRPHLTWLFVAPLVSGYGIGTALLSNAVPELLKLGYGELVSTFLCGNESSTLWHWRNGFELLEYPGSKRRIRREISENRTKPSE